MAILKNRTQGNYVTVSQVVMRNKRLGITERGLLVTLSLSKKGKLLKMLSMLKRLLQM